MDSPKDALARIKRAFAGPLIVRDSHGRERRRADSDPARFSPCGRKVNQPGIDWRSQAVSSSRNAGSGRILAQYFSRVFEDPRRNPFLTASVLAPLSLQSCENVALSVFRGKRTTGGL